MIRAGASAGRAHVSELDGLRGIAVALVMLYHFTDPARLYGPLGRFYGQIASRGGVGVLLFFVLSGYLITGILSDAKGTPGYYRNFYARRAVRIFPLYYGVLALAFGVLHLGLGVRYPKLDAAAAQQVWLWTYTNNIHESLVSQATPIFGHFWSLAVEEHFYLVWPLAVALLPRRAMLAACGVCVAVALGTRWLLLASGADPAYAVLRLTLCQLDALALGGALALVRRGPGGADRLRALAPAVLGPAAALLFARHFLFPGALPAWPVFLASDNLLWALLFGAIIVLAVSPAEGRPGTARRFVLWAPLRSLGKYSYAVYVFHWPLGRAVLELKGRLLPHLPFADALGGIGGELVFTAAASVVSVGAALVSWHLYEKHFLKLKRHFEYTDRPGLAKEA